MGTEFKGLENKLVDVRVGDILHLQAENNDNVVGYVKHLSTKIVKLSHGSPENSESYDLRWYLSNGDREYPLEKFKHYQVLKVKDSSDK